jgi:2-keto-4-pentenoate hydratase
MSVHVSEAAHRLAAAAGSGRPCPPVRDLIDAHDLAAAYAIQTRNVEARVAAGARVVGRKIGLTSVAVQQQLGVDTPDFGVLLDDMDVTGRPVPIERLLQPKAEAEIAFTLGADLDGELTPDVVRAAVSSAHVALEIVDSRIADWDISYADTVADNASSGLFALGDELVGVEPRDVEMQLTLNGAVVSTGNGAACLGDPLGALLWLARTAQEYGDPLRAGQLVLSGALGPMAAVSGGDTVVATLTVAGREVGRVDVHFTPPPVIGALR